MIGEHAAPAILALRDGSVFKGEAIGAAGVSVGEVVFNTAMTGYQEILTDPSYARQLVALTYPHIGNTGGNPVDEESGGVWAAGLIVRDAPPLASNFRSEQPLREYLAARKVVAIAGIDTRRLTRLLREKGAQDGCLIAGPDADKKEALERARAAAAEFPGLKGMDLAREVSTGEVYDWGEREARLRPSPAVSGDDGDGGASAAREWWGSAWRPVVGAAGGAAAAPPPAGRRAAPALSHSPEPNKKPLEGGAIQSAPGAGAAPAAPNNPLHVVAYDFGVKRNILRMLAARGCRVTVVPAQTAAADALKLAPDGIFLSNGPGDPEPCDYAVKAIRELLQTDIPLFGICLGHQLLGLACGARTVKMKFGHHGANHPVQCMEDGSVLITSQNHGFAVDAAGLPECLEITHQSLFDGSLQGIRHRRKPAFGFQGHPEASPGPRDAAPLFDQFINMMRGNGGTRPPKPAPKHKPKSARRPKAKGA